jgi:hypothetical protein
VVSIRRATPEDADGILACLSAAFAEHRDDYGPLPIEARFHSALMLSHLGKKECALQMIDSMRSDAGAQVCMMAGLAEALALAGAGERAEQIVSDFSLLDSEPVVSRFRQAALALALGRKKDCLALLAQAVKDKEAELVWIGVDPRFDGIRNAPAFRSFANRVFVDTVFPKRQIAVSV